MENSFSHQICELTNTRLGFIDAWSTRKFSPGRNLFDSTENYNCTMHFFSFLMELKQKRIYPNSHVCRAQTYDSITSSEYAYNNSYMKEILEWFPTEFDNLENA